MLDTEYNSLGLPNFLYGSDCLPSNFPVLLAERADPFEASDDLLVAKVKLAPLDAEALYVELVPATRHAVKCIWDRHFGMNVDFLCSTNEEAPK